ncbi:MAG TPA: TIGR03086 family metal-binding protein [Acidimicrobiales bacterium]|nr:TIGR03086 family metal-binding protein [Acidimicrobiales bacterium]
MSETAQRYATVADAFTARVAGVAADAWSAPTPCTQWTVRDLVAHVVGTHRRVVATVDGTPPEDVDPEGDLASQWRAATAEVRAALGDEARASHVVSGMFGEQSFESLVGRLVCSDTLVHTWDLARATGQDELLDPDAVAKAFAFLTPMDEAIRRPGGFGPKIAPPTDADEQNAFLSFCGRAV